ncbi:MAG: HAMP domain-containing histidine kinase [Acidobacteria bacterium]|nr:HAMP domain-containing histidine kinase [Acidobacteriota bacterium]
MNVDHIRRQAVLSWISVGFIGMLCAVLAVLQYRWLGDVSRGEQERLKTSLAQGMARLSRDYNQELTSVAVALLPSAARIEEEGRDAAYLSRFRQWRETGTHIGLFKRVAIAVPRDKTIELFRIETSGIHPDRWPDAWIPIRDQMLRRLNREFGPLLLPQDRSLVLEIPRFARVSQEAGPRSFREQEWLVAEIDPEYASGPLLNMMIRRHLGSEYLVRVAERITEGKVIRAEPEKFEADASVAILEVNMGQIMWRGLPRPVREEMARGKKGPGGPPPGPPAEGRGRWQLSVRDKGGSFETMVARARMRNLLISGAILALMLIAAAALVRFSRQSQQLAEIQMNFVAGVSHELRTPLTVIRTAAYNLRGKIASNPAQVEKYGSLIQKESEKLTAIVEQVLRFASAKAGQVIREKEPVTIDSIIDRSLQSARPTIDSARVEVERRVETGLPLILGDSVALQHAVENLILNAVKYGTESSNWIGVSARMDEASDGAAVEIRVADRGPGIPEDEVDQLFEPFFRGRRAVQDQIHGTGLGLNLVRKIVEAHGGTIRVISEPMKGAEFIVRIPVAPAEYQDEFAHTAS